MKSHIFSHTQIFKFHNRNYSMLLRHSRGLTTLQSLIYLWTDRARPTCAFNNLSRDLVTNLFDMCFKKTHKNQLPDPIRSLH